MSKVITSENVNAFVESVTAQKALAKYVRVSHVRDNLLMVELGFENKESNAVIDEYSAWVKHNDEKLELWLTGELSKESPCGIIGYNITKEDHFVVMDDDWYVRAVVCDAFGLTNKDDILVSKLITKAINAAGFYTQEEHERMAQDAMFI